MARPLPRIRRPCDECPWRRDAQPGRFETARWTALRSTSYDDGSAQLGSPMFACHKTDEGGERACAGWLAVEGCNHVSVRLAVISGDLPVEALSPGPGWPDLFDSFAETAAHDMGDR